VLSNCSTSGLCPQVDINSRQSTSLNSSAADVATFATGGELQWNNNTPGVTLKIFCV
jgi:hypothetical protein